MLIPDLQTSRLLLRGISDADLDSLAALYADGEVMRYLADGLPKSREQTAERLALMQFRWARYRCPMWVTVDRSTGAWLGRCGFTLIDLTKNWELTYGFIRAAWGRGLATEAAEAVLAWVFDSGGKDEMLARVRPENAASLRVLEKLGFRKQREVVECHGGPASLWRLGRDEFALRGV